MRIIHQNRYTPEELAVFRRAVNKNLADIAKDISLAMKKIGGDCVEGINRRRYSNTNDPYFRLASDIANAIDSLWKDPIIATVMDHSSEFYPSSFFAQVQRIAQREYITTESDVLRARAKTTGISETRFNMGHLSIHRHVHHLLRRLSEYDQVLLEEKEQNRMAESLVLFESVINSRGSPRTSIILFLNKIAVFKAKLPKVPLDHEKAEVKGGTDGDEPGNDLHTHADTRNTLTNAHTQDNQPVEETLNAGQDGIGLEKGSSDNEQNSTGHGVTGDKVAEFVADQPSTKVSSLALGPNILGGACILAVLSAVAYQSLQISYSSPLPGPVASHPDHAPDKISPQPLSAIIWPAACILSIFANIYFVLRKADSPPSRDREKPATSTLERG
ncbi:Guanine nucleotide-binding protein alpha-2 subunit [Tulasnella sp. 408]|nr:Guanine nucleotide-binding protein alpha-2 subunit [Tulasnella sp. 408]